MSLRLYNGGARSSHARPRLSRNLSRAYSQARALDSITRARLCLPSSSVCNLTLGIAQNAQNAQHSQHDSGQALFTSLFRYKRPLVMGFAKDGALSNIITQAKCLHFLLSSPTRRSLWCPRRILGCSTRRQSSLVTVIQQPRTVVHLDRHPAPLIDPPKIFVVSSTQGCVTPNLCRWELETNTHFRGYCSKRRYVH